MRSLLRSLLMTALAFPCVAAAEEDGKFADVTATVTAAVADNALSIVASNDDLGGDPAPGVTKSLRVEYKVGDKPETTSVNEGETLTIKKPAAGAKLTIVKAIYGGLPSIGKIAVTPRLTSAITDGKLTIDVSNEAMGSDPAPGVTKQLWVKYLIGSTEKQITVGEGEQLSLPAAADGAGRLVIKEAVYGESPAPTTQPQP